MTLRIKTLLLIGALIALMLVIMNLIASFTFLQPLDEQERQIARQEVAQILAMYNNELQALDRFTRDYGLWDDTYQFIQTGTPQYIQSNMGDTTFDIGQLSLIVFINSNGEVVYGKAFDLEREVAVPIPAELITYCQPGSPLLRTNSLQSYTGLILLPSGPLLVAASPILTSEGEGPSQGTVLMGRPLNLVHLAQLGGLSPQALAGESPANPELSPDFKAARAALLSGETVFVTTLDSKTIGSYTLLRDALGQPALLLGLKSERLLHQRGLLFRRTLVGTIGVVGLIFEATILVILETIVLSRLSRLSRDVITIGKQGDLAARVTTLSGQDELTELTNTINAMLGALEQGQIERETMARSLQASEARSRAIAELVSDYAYVLRMDPPGIEWVTEALTRIGGYTRAELEQLSLEIIYPDDRAAHAAFLARLQAGQESREEVRLVTKEGQIIWVNNYGRPEQDAAGRVVRLYVAGQDITKRKRAEAALRLQNEYFAALHETTLGLINRLDVRDLLQVIVSRAVNLVNTRDGFIYLVKPTTGNLVLEVGTGIYQDQVGQDFQPGEGLTDQVLQTGAVVTVDDYDHWPKRWSAAPPGLLHAAVGLPLFSEGRVVGVLGVTHADPQRVFSPEEVDLLARLAQLASLALDNAQLFQTVRDERSRLRALIEASHDGVALTGMDGKILFLNEQALRFLGLPPGTEAWMGHPITRIMELIRPYAPDLVRTFVKEFRRIQRGDEPPGQGELTLPPYSLQWQNLPVLVGEVPLGRLIVLHDLTVIRASEQLRRDMVNMLVHDLRGPLTPIYFFVQYMQMEAADSQDEILNRSLQAAGNNIEKLSNLIDFILEIGQLEEGQLTLHRAPLDLPELIGRVLDLQTTVAAAKQQTLVQRAIPPLPPVWGDSGLLERVLQNLVGNALKFTPPGGTITVTVQANATASQVIVAVNDTGAGIPPEIQGRLFQKFSKGRHQERGWGLGLAFCKAVLEAHGGHIWVESEPGKGATFYFMLPVR